MMYKETGARKFMPEVTAIIEESSGELREIQVSVESPFTNIPIKYLGSYKFINGLLLLFQNFPESKIRIVDGSDFYVYGSDRNYFDMEEGCYGLLKEWDWDRDYDLTKDEPFCNGWFFSIYKSVNYADSKDLTR